MRQQHTITVLYVLFNAAPGTIRAVWLLVDQHFVITIQRKGAGMFGGPVLFTAAAEPFGTKTPRDGFAPAIGIVLATTASCLLWAVLAHTARWAACLF